MEILNRYGSESNAVELRQTVAHAMKQLWILVKDDSYLVQYYWMLTFNLLQDPVDIVRNEMAKSISTALSNEMISYPGMPQLKLYKSLVPAFSCYLVCT